MRTYHLFLVAIAISITSSFAQSTQAKIVYKAELEVPYYSNEESAKDPYMQEMCVFDFYYPENIQDFPTIVWFHGGGLTGGKRFIPDYLKDHGFAIMGVGYRLSPNVKQ